jgi:2-amino-4-hydroxy-6-hydroxymethyldihydropteridine diphosphokinase
MPTAYIGLGTNLGDRDGNLVKAVNLLRGHPDLEVTNLAKPIETDPVDGPEEQEPYLNSVVEVVTDLPPAELLQACQLVEELMGRTRTVRWGPRIIDLDLLLYDDVILDEPGLTVPHIEMHARLFVLGPLAEIAPGARHPVTGETVREMLEALRRMEG